MMLACNDLQTKFSIENESHGFHDLNMQIFISRDGGNKKYSSVLAPGQHEGLQLVTLLIFMLALSSS